MNIEDKNKEKNPPVEDGNKGKETPPQPSMEELIKQVEELKKNTVSKDKYDKEVHDKALLMQALIDGAHPGNGQEEPPEKVDVSALRQELYGPNRKQMTNLQVAEKVLKLREQCLEKGQPDPFLPHGDNYVPNAEDQASADRVAEAFEHCIEYAEGDPDLFVSELDRITKDAVFIPKR